jgi:hypothetical protein
MKKVQILISFLLLTFVIAESCKNNSIIDEIVNIPEVATISQLSDSSFFAQIFDIRFVDNQYYFADYKTNMVYQCSDKFDLIKRIGGLGKGPGDFLAPCEVYPTANSIYVFEEMNQRISIFDNDFNFAGMVNNDYRGNLMAKSYIDDSSNLFCCVNGIDAPLLKFNLKTGKKNYFGSYKPFKSIMERVANNDYQIIPYGDYILAISHSDPKIDIYDKHSLQILGTYSYENNEVAKSRTDYARREIIRDPKNSESTYILVQDACIYDNRLFLLLVDDFDVHPTLNKLACFDISDKTIKYLRTYCLSTREKSICWFNCFALNSKNQIVAFSPQTSMFYLFKM